MNAKDVIKNAMDFNRHVLSSYIADMSDADLLVRPVPAANHIAWQLGHLINSEAQLLSSVPGATLSELPAGFADQYSSKTAAVEPPMGFGTKESYLTLLGKVRTASLEALAKMPDSDLDRPNPGRMEKLAPTIGSLFMLLANHDMMHAGQFTVVRRKLGKPVLF